MRARFLSSDPIGALSWSATVLETAWLRSDMHVLPEERWSRFPGSRRSRSARWLVGRTGDGGLAQGRAAFGGLLSGVALRALRELVPGERRLRSVLVDFIGPAGPGPLEIDARVLRSGRALTQAEARVHQEGTLVAVVIAAYGADRTTGISWPAASRPEVPDPTSLMGFPFLPGITPAFTQHFDYRWATHRLPFTGAECPEVRGFVRPGPDEGHVDEAMLLALIDAWPAPYWRWPRGRRLRVR